MSGFVKRLSDDIPLRQQFMRPVFLVQIIFVGYMCLTSVFFFMNALGYKYFSYQEFSLVNYRSVELAALCQRYYLLGHTAYAIGLLMALKINPVTKWKMSIEGSVSVFFIKASLVLVIASFVFNYMPGLDQFAIKCRELSYLSSILALVYSVFEKKTEIILITGFIFGLNFIAAVLSGWKEPVVVTIIILAAYFYPIYRKTVVMIFIPVFIAATFILPSYNALFRELAWSEGIEAEEAAQSAFDAMQQGEVDIQEGNWAFLTNRLSEVSMFIEYVYKVPAYMPYYGTEIIENSLLFLIPRVFWPDKPDVEQHVMQRVYDVGITSAIMNVSAKPPLIVDAYLIGGAFSIFIILFLFGLLTSGINNLCEYLFGGYLYGTAWVFTGIFQIFWKGACMEFLLNSIFWAVIAIYLLFFTLRWMGYIELKQNSK